MPGDQPIAWPKAEEASRAVRVYLQTLDAARSEEKSGRSDDDRSIGGGRRKPPKEISLTDPQAAWVARKSTDPFFAYDANYLIDNKAGIIVDAEGTRANRIAEIAGLHGAQAVARHRYHRTNALSLHRSDKADDANGRGDSTKRRDIKAIVLKSHSRDGTIKRQERVAGRLVYALLPVLPESLCPD